MKKQQGFTLIELMIVVAVIGVLSAIAIPQYQRYVAKAEVASALATVSGVKTNVEAHAVETGSFPNGQSAALALGVPSMDIGSISLVQDTDDTGAIVFQFGTTASASVSSIVAEKYFKLARTSAGSWECSSGDDNNADGVDESLLPKNCK
ncbi:pilin [Photobacterium leiognathi]|uniref:pilin n=1 Tax=Photobacterium leiognathi TaxID=553611 RepID=UPI00076A5932|nr:pilin [Photobacterium leiognathi]